MLRLFSAFLMVLCVLPLSARAEVAADSTIKAVTVYTNRATVTRAATVRIPAGKQTVVFKGLPAILVPDSLRAEGNATASVQFGALTHKRVISHDLTSTKEKELNDQLEALNDQIRLVGAETKALAARKSFLENIGKQAQLRTDEEIAELNLNPEQWKSASLALYEGMDEVLKSEVALDIKKRGLDKQIRKIRDELNQLRTGQRSTYEVSVPLESVAQTDLTISLSYQVPRAGWTPIYDARLDTAKEMLRLVQYGAVRQQTGEDWSGVDLTLSTAQPQRGASLPDLNPWWVDLYSVPRRERMVMQKLAAPMAAMDAMMEMEEGASLSAAAPMVEKMDAEFAVAEINMGGFVSEYKIPGPATVLADGSETKLMVGTFDTESALAVHIKPQLSTEAFLVAQTKLKGEAPILPGSASLFRDGAFVGQTHLPLLRPAEEYTMYFGVDDQMAVKRKIMMDERKDAGMISRDNTREKHVLTAIENLHNQAVNIIIEETIPTARNEKIEVKIIKDATTDGYEQDADDTKGLLRWSVDLKPKAGKDVKLGWKVIWPKDENVSGL